MTSYECCFSQIAKYAAQKVKEGVFGNCLRVAIEDRSRFLLTQNSYRQRLASGKATDAEREKLRALITISESECVGFNRKNIDRAQYLIFQRYRLLSDDEKGLAKDLFKLNSVSIPNGQPSEKQYKSLADMVSIPHA